MLTNIYRHNAKMVRHFTKLDIEKNVRQYVPYYNFEYIKTFNYHTILFGETSVINIII